MPVVKPIDDMPKPGPSGDNAPLTGEETLLAHRLADAWWKLYEAEDEYERAMPELPLRASMMGTRCDRALHYDIIDQEESDPAGPSFSYRMMMGKKAHDAVAAVLETGKLDAGGLKHGWFDEEVVDLRPAGYPGSAHGDLVYYDHGVPSVVAENKTIGGFAYKKCAARFNGGPDGPRWEHVMQAAIVAVARNIPKIVVLYLAMEPLSPDVAKSTGTDEYGKFIAEWHADTEDWRAAVQVEVARQKRVLRLSTPDDEGQYWRPERTIVHPDLPGGAFITNPNSGKWDALDANGRTVKSGKVWYCGYCRHRQTCLDHGPDMVRLNITPRPAPSMEDLIADAEVGHNGQG